MNCIQDVPGAATAYLAMEFRGGAGVEKVTVDLQPTPRQTAAIVRRKVHELNQRGMAPQWDESFHVWRMMKPLAREDIAASIKRKRPNRSLLSVQSDSVFGDDLDVRDYWVVDWPATVAILRELENAPS